MRAIFACAALMLAISPVAEAQRSPVHMSVLPSGRTGAPNTPVTFFATIANTSDQAMTCTPRFGGFISLAGVTAQARYYEMDDGAIIGGANAPANVPANGSTQFLVELNVSGAYVGEARSIIDCVDENAISTTIPQLPLVNSYRLDIAPGSRPDIIMIGQTISGDGVARVAETGPRSLLMTVAAINNGAAGSDVVVEPGLSLFWPLDDAIAPTVCQTDAAGVCFAPPAESLTIADWPADETRFFAVRACLGAEIGAPFFPDILRLELKAGEYADNLVNGTSVATDGRRSNGATGLASVQYCHSRLDSDVTGDWAREGFLVAEDDWSGGQRLRGVTRVSELGLDRTPGQILGFDTRRSAGGLPNGELNLQGRLGAAQTGDTRFAVTVRTLPSGAGVIIWDSAQPDAVEDFRQAGRMRCAPAPQPEGETPDQTGSYAVVPDDPDTSLTMTVEEILRTVDTSTLDLRIESEPDEIVAGAFWAFFSLGTEGSLPDFPRARTASGNAADFESRGGVLPLTWDDTPDGRILTCAIVFVSGIAETDGADDAVAELIVRDGYTPETAGDRCRF